MAIATITKITDNLVLNNGTSSTGRVKQLSINTGGGQEKKTNASTDGAYAVAIGVKTLYSQPLLLIKRTTTTEIEGS